MSEAKQWTLSVIDFANQPKEYEWWIRVPYIERLRHARELREMVYVLQQRPRRAFQPVFEIIEH